MLAVAILTHSADRYVPERLIGALEARGVAAVRIDTDRYPQHLDLSLGLEQVRLGDIALRAVYARRIAGPRLDHDAAATVSRECRLHWQALADLTPQLRWVNPRNASASVAGHKLHQLREAKRCGLSVPPTLLSNDPEAVRHFATTSETGLVCKLLGAEARLDRTGQVHTHAVDAAMLADLDGLREGPMCFQHRIEATREARIQWVDGRCFAGAVQRRPGTVDWRKPGHTVSGWQPYTVDADTADRLNTLMTRLGLVTGAIDLMLPEHEAPVFLEVNPEGEWGMLEHALDLPVSDALAEALLEQP